MTNQRVPLEPPIEPLLPPMPPEPPIEPLLPELPDEPPDEPPMLGVE